MRIALGHEPKDSTNSTLFSYFTYFFVSLWFPLVLIASSKATRECNNEQRVKKYSQKSPSTSIFTIMQWHILYNASLRWFFFCFHPRYFILIICIVLLSTLKGSVAWVIEMKKVIFSLYFSSLLYKRNNKVLLREFHTEFTTQNTTIWAVFWVFP